MTRTPHSLLQLEEQTKRIEQVSAHVEDYRLKDITELLSDTARLASYANREIKAQSDAWLEIKQSASVDAKAYQELQRSLAATNQLQAQEISRLHDVLGKAERPSAFNSVVSLIATFFLGVVTSILGDYLKRKFSARFLQAVGKVWATITGRRGISERLENGVKARGIDDVELFGGV
jgi:hypothetical protein